MIGGFLCLQNLYQKLYSKEEQIALVGLGYVGMPIASSLRPKGKRYRFDTNTRKIGQYKAGIDPTARKVGDEAVRASSVQFTSDEKMLRQAKFHIIAVPTPINADKTPDLQPVESASRVVGRNLTKGSVVVYESTVFPGVTEDVCVPILEKESGLVCGRDFKVGYSPERINPGRQGAPPFQHQENCLRHGRRYARACRKGIRACRGSRRTPCGQHKVAEAAKVVENSQRDINIAFMNELALVFDKMGIDTKEVIEAMNTKWNALRFYPGLVGGHCIGVDPYYFIYQAEKLGYHSQIIAAGRKVNDSMGKFVANPQSNSLFRPISG